MKHHQLLKTTFFIVVSLFTVINSGKAGDVIAVDSCDNIACNALVNISVQKGSAYAAKPEMFLEGRVCMDRRYTIYYYDANNNKKILDSIRYDLPDFFTYEVEESKNGNSCWGRVEMKKIDCNGALACNDDVILRVKQGESYPTAPGLFLEGSWCIDHKFTIERLDSSGNQIDFSRVHENLPSSFTYVVTDEDTGNSCWGTATIRVVDCSIPFTPNLTSITDTVDCFQSIEPDSIGFPVPDSAIVTISPAGGYIVSNWSLCEEPILTYGEEVVAYSCQDPFSARMVRTWVLYTEDQRQFISRDTFYFNHGNLDNIRPLHNYDGIDRPILDCSDPWNTGNGIPPIEITGSPFASNTCRSVVATYDETIIVAKDNPCEKELKILREWHVIDWCSGEIKDLVQVIKVACGQRDTMAPVAICRTGLRVALNQNGQVRLWVEDIDDGSFDDCGIASLSFDSSAVVSFLDFDRSDIGNHDVTLYVTDYSGKQTYCIVLVTIVGSPAGGVGNLGGRHLSYNLNPIDINTILPSLRYEVYNGTGGQKTPVCDLPANPRDLSYAVCVDQSFFPGPYNLHLEHDDHGNFLNGVSTLDYVLLIKMLLARPPYNPYLLRAADIDNNSSVSAADASLLRAIILGQKRYEEDYWQFLTASPTNPYWIQGLDIDNLPNYDVDFVPVRIGDLSNVTLNQLKGNISTRSPREVTMYIDDIDLEAGKTYNVRITSDEIQTAVAIQMGLFFDESAVDLINLTNPGLSSSGDWRGYSDEVRFIHVDNNLNAYNVEGDFIHLTFNALRSGKLSDFVNVETFPLEFLLISEDLEEVKVNLQFRSVTSTVKVGEDSPISISPNPFNDFSEIDVSSLSDARGTLEVFSLSGTKVFTSKLENIVDQDKIRLDNSIITDRGVYMVVVTTDQETHVLKVSKQ